MRELSVEARPQRRATWSRQAETRFHTIAVYSSLALIGAIVFGAVSVHPF